MAEFGPSSMSRLNTCHPDLIRLFLEVVKFYDCQVLYLGGHRNEQQQNELYPTYSKVKWPNSKHNRWPSQAADIAPYFATEPHVRWDDKESFYHFAGYVRGVAEQMGIKIRWGGDWDGDFDLTDQTFYDLAHFELWGIDD